MKNHLKLTIFCLFLILGATASVFAGGDKEYTGQFDTALIANVEDHEKIVFKYVTADAVKSETALNPTAHLTAGQFIKPQGNGSVRALLVEEEDSETPHVFVDLNDDLMFGKDEKFELKQEEKDNPYLWSTTVNLPVKDNFFTTCALFVRYFKSYKIEKMTPQERLFTQSTEVYARGRVDLGGRKVLVQYAYSFVDKSIDFQEGWQGMDGDENGEIDMNELSPEAAKAAKTVKETIVFRVGQSYLSTKKVDLKKNQIVLREHEAKDYRRIELAVGKAFPEFEFTDFDGKKRRFSEFRGKYVLLDVWGFWCPPCRKEMPYLREAAKRFKNRNLVLVGLNTDPVPFEEVKRNLEENNMLWTQAKFESVFDFLNKQLRIESFPTTFLITPGGVILSMSRHERGEPDLRGKDLLETLDEILPESE
ncbi:MAG TPA: TlpA disulfide reductase family protein [Pyrinomonadaceae bacterium]|nr:TlpA disulfide reductase family protein [Pyrinomonadaceae bacterium]